MVIQFMTELVIALGTELVAESVVELVTGHAEWNAPRGGTHQNM